jgi:excisionase family DNA binding protein
VPEQYPAVSKAAALIGVSLDTLPRCERDGRIKAVRTPTAHRRFKRSDVEALLRD